MATLKTIKSLAAEIGNVLFTDDPIVALEKKGITPSAELQQQILAKARKPLTTVENRRALIKEMKRTVPPGFTNKFRFVNQKKINLLFSSLEDGDYDIVVVIQVTLINEILAGLQDTRTWPTVLTLQQATSLFPLDNLSEMSNDVPIEEWIFR